MHKTAVKFSLVLLLGNSLQGEEVLLTQFQIITIIASCVGGVLLLCLLAVCQYFFCQRRRPTVSLKLFDIKAILKLFLLLKIMCTNDKNVLKRFNKKIELFGFYTQFQLDTIPNELDPNKHNLKWAI